MRATALPVLAGLLCGSLACAGVVGCDAPLHLEPAGVGGASSSTGSTARACSSNPDCAFPNPVCDTVTATCVGCLTVSDCAYMPGTICSQGSCECPPGGSCVSASTASSSSSGAGGAGTGTGGFDGGASDAAPDAAACVPKCSEALTQGGAVCPGTVSATDYTKLKACVGCAGTAICAPACAGTFCMELPPNAACKNCLQSHCLVPFDVCQAN
jgi:hypothetical protein